jgi:hypothetical protein
MGRFKAAIESQAAQLAGVNATTTLNGYFAACVAGASANFKLRRLILGVRAGAGVPTSQQVTVAIYKQTVRASGTGIANTVGQNMDPRGAASATGARVQPVRAAVVQHAVGVRRAVRAPGGVHLRPGRRERDRFGQHRQCAARVAPVHRFVRVGGVTTTVV